MKKQMIFIFSSLALSTASAKIEIENNSIPLKKLPFEILENIKKDYIGLCEMSSDPDELEHSSAKIHLDKTAIINIDFNGDGVKDYIIDESKFYCENNASLFIGNSSGHLHFFFKTPTNKYKKTLTFWKARDEFVLQSTNSWYRYYSEYSKSYLEWNKEKSTFIYYDGPSKKIKYAKKPYLEATFN